MTPPGCRAARSSRAHAPTGTEMTSLREVLTARRRVTAPAPAPQRRQHVVDRRAAVAAAVLEAEFDGDDGDAPVGPCGALRVHWAPDLVAVAQFGQRRPRVARARGAWRRDFRRVRRHRPQCAGVGAGRGRQVAVGQASAPSRSTAGQDRQAAEAVSEHVVQDDDEAHAPLGQAVMILARHGVGHDRSGVMTAWTAQAMSAGSSPGAAHATTSRCRPHRSRGRRPTPGDPPPSGAHCRRCRIRGTRPSARERGCQRSGVDLVEEQHGTHVGRDWAHVGGQLLGVTGSDPLERRSPDHGTTIPHVRDPRGRGGPHPPRGHRPGRPAAQRRRHPPRHEDLGVP